MLRIRSGGQSGVDRGALLGALDTNVDYTGWVPKGGLCEDTTHLLEVFPHLRETESADYRQRTELNVRDAQATIVVTPSGTPTTPGSRLTVECCQRLNRPYRVVTPVQLSKTLCDLVWGWKNMPLIDVNIAGTRESKAPGIQNQVRLAIIDAIRKLDNSGIHVSQLGGEQEQ